MAELIRAPLRTFKNYHHTFLIEMTDLHEGSELQYIRDFLKSGKRFDDNHPGVTGQTLDRTYNDNRSIFHYFCNRTKALTGVYGGVMYKYNDVYLYIAFSNPLIGRRKCFVELAQENHTAKWAYTQLLYSDETVSTCRGWKVRAEFKDTRQPELTVEVGKDDNFLQARVLECTHRTCETDMVCNP